MRRFGSLFFGVLIALLSLPTTAALAVGTGDIALISFASDDPDALAFVALREIPAATQLRFTDSGWMASGGFRATEGGIQFTAGTTLPPGTVVSRVAPFDSGEWSINSAGVGSAGLALATAGDQILTFVGSAASPSFIHAVNFDSAGYSDATSSNTTGLPPGLTVGVTAVDVSEADNGYYDGPTSGTPSDLLIAIADPANWITSNNPITPPDWVFTIDGAGPVLIDVSIPGSEFAIGEIVNITATLSQAPEAGSPVTIELTSGAFSAPQQLEISNPNADGTVAVALDNEGVWSVQATAVLGGAGSDSSGTFSVGDPLVPPTADAGPDHNVSLTAATITIDLDGATGDDAEGLAGVSYAWTPATAPGILNWANRTGSLNASSDPGLAIVTFDAVGTYMLTLTITDSDGLTDDDMATVTVSDPGAESEFDPPPGYYAGATGLGSVLKQQLADIMASGHNQQNYGDFRYNAADYDADPQIPGNILLVYNRASVPGTWDSGATWSREHVWPQSRQPGTASNSSKGNLGDPFALRPVDPSINGQRGNKPFGTVDSSGGFGDRAAYWFPGEEDKGDMARSNFYSATRYLSTLSLVSGMPSGDTMGDLDSILRWHYTDVPDDFERRRNQRIYEDQNNRNAFIDHPEFVWTIFGDGANDSTLYVSTNEPPDGVSSTSVDFPPVIVGGPAPSTSAALLHKAGNDPTYYSVTASGSATSSINGRFNAFDFGPQQVLIDVGLSASTATAGEISGSVVIDNLDVSSEGAGEGAADGDDAIDVSLAVLDHSEASLNSLADVNSLDIDFGIVDAGGSVTPVTFDIFNLPSPSGFTADLALQSVNASGDSAVLSTAANPFTGLPAGQSMTFDVSFDTQAGAGTYQATYTLIVADENLPGASSGTPLVLNITGTVSGIPAVPALSTAGTIIMMIVLLGAGGLILHRRMGMGSFD